MLHAEKNKATVKIYFLVPAPPGISPGQRFRFEHYMNFLKQNYIQYKVSAFYTLSGWKTLFTPGKSLKKAAVVIRGVYKRMIDLFLLVNYDYVFVYREAAPLGPPVFEFIISRILNKKIIYDFDDAIWIQVVSQYNKAALYLKWFSKIGAICRWSNKVSVGNDFLARFAVGFNRNVIIIPTVVDTELVQHSTQAQLTDRPAIGWTGTFSTLKYLDMIVPVLQRLQDKYDFVFIVIADKNPELPLRNYKYIPWQKESEERDLLNMHAGVMPLFDDEFSKGKCGFKAIQYMSLGIPAVVSPVGVNSIIVDEGINGFCCKNEKEWEAKLSDLLEDPALRQRLGAEAKKKIETNYSVIATRERFLALFS